MRKRLIATCLSLLTLVLLALELPLAADYAAQRTERTVLDRDADATRFASLADPALRSEQTSDLADELERYSQVYGISAALADRDGRFIMTTGRSADFTGGAVQRAVLDALAGERVGEGRTVWPWQSEPLIIAVPVSSGGEVTGAVVTVSPTDRLRSDVLRVWTELAAIGLAAYAVFAAFAVVLARWLLRPIAKLAAAAQGISDGALDTRVPAEGGPPELRRLALSFNTMADDLVDALGRQQQFVAQASHQMRNPLTALILRVEELGEYITEPYGRTEHRLALEETVRLQRLLDGLLALARAERGRYVFERVDAADIADERVAAWLPLSAERGITLRRTGEHEPAPVVAVTTAVGQVLDALVDNALKFAGGGAEVAVDVSIADERVYICVTDDGPGLCDGDRSRATERFWRASDVQNVEGSGLGLPIAAVLVGASGGELELSAAEPTGLRARLSFPLAASSGDGEEGTASHLGVPVVPDGTGVQRQRTGLEGDAAV